MSTWQKLAPFVLLSQLQGPNTATLMISLGLLSTLIGGCGGLNQTQTRKILAYSSIAHLGWIVLVVQFLPYLGLLTLIVYCILTTSAFLTLKTNQATSVNKLALA